MNATCFPAVSRGPRPGLRHAGMCSFMFRDLLKSWLLRLAPPSIASLRCLTPPSRCLRNCRRGKKPKTARPKPAPPSDPQVLTSIAMVATAFTRPARSHACLSTCGRTLLPTFHVSCHPHRYAVLPSKCRCGMCTGMSRQTCFVGQPAGESVYQVWPEEAVVGLLLP